MIDARARFRPAEVPIAHGTAEPDGEAADYFGRNAAAERFGPVGAVLPERLPSWAGHKQTIR